MRLRKRHFRLPDGRSACGSFTNVYRTPDRESVTCLQCKSTNAYRERGVKGWEIALRERRLDTLKVAVVEAAMQRWNLADVDGGMGAYTDACIAEDAACAALAAAEQASRPAKAEREDGR